MELPWNFFALPYFFIKIIYNMREPWTCKCVNCTCLLPNKLYRDNILFKSIQNGKRKQKREEKIMFRAESFCVKHIYFLYCMQVSSSNCKTIFFLRIYSLCSFKKSKEENNGTASTFFHFYEVLNIYLV